MITRKYVKDPQHTLKNTDHLYTVYQAGEEIGVLAKTILKWLERGYINRRGVERKGMGRPRVLVDITELRQFMQQRQ